MSGKDGMFRAPASAYEIDKAEAGLSKIEVRALFGGGDDAEAHFVRRAFTPSDVSWRQIL
jgi:hypothetical protein